ncbi:MAG: T9SS type A sorting domain-containing protein [Fibrobacteres bacterium]|nr:T9SS type A sorting domain-containing protein [Fibrobacterota bacterium]
MKTLLILLIFIALTFSENTKHVFWYKCIQNNYKITDSANGFGPNIQGDVIKHEGKALTASILYDSETSIWLGNSVQGPSGRSFVIWYMDLCGLKLSEGAKLKSAKFRGEYKDNFMGDPLCIAGPIYPRVGVVKMQGHFDDLGVTPSNHPDNATWADLLNPLSGCMGYDKSGCMVANNFEAQEIKNILAPYGNNGKGSKPLEGKFFEMDITTQVQFILDHEEQHGIASVVTPGDGSTGKISLYAYEDGFISGATSDPWTQDGNTTHLLLEIENGTLIPKDQNASEKVSIVSNKLSLAVQPNPFNASTQIVYNCGNGIKGTLTLYSIDGKISFSKKIQGTGSHTLNATNLSNGVYVCRLDTKEGQLTERLLSRK